jgi:excinuclease ABC subunit A
MNIASDNPMICIRGARTHNLRNIDVDLPSGKLIVMTGVSGSGKSSLAFDTLFAEGQRRYLESVSIQTRTLLRQLPRPDVDDITGLAPTISVDQRVSSVPVRNTLAVTAEIHDFLRLLYSRGGTAHCTSCGRSVQRQSVDQILQRTLLLPERTRLMILSPMVRGRRGGHKDVLERIARNGFVRARIDGEVVDIAEATSLDAKKSHAIEAIVDRIVLKDGISPRLRESIELACRESDGTCIISHESDGTWNEKLYSTRFSCPDCDLNFATPEPRSFSFTSPWGACPECTGLGVQGDLMGSDPVVTVAEAKDVRSFASTAVMKGSDPIKSPHHHPCKICYGSRLQPFPSTMTFLSLTIQQFSQQSVADALKTVEDWISQVGDAACTADVSLSQESRLVAERTLPDIRARLKCLNDVGIGYLTLNRSTRTLSGGEFQRARLASSLSSQLHGSCLILDEPTAGLHPRDTQRLLKTLNQLRDSGSTVIVVEHDGDIIRAADWLIDLGPGAGVDGGQLLFAGTPADAKLYAQSPTGKYLRGELPEVASSPIELTTSSRRLTIRNARLNNLKNMTVDLPLDCLVCVTGVSGSGKSSLITDTLLPIVAAVVNRQCDPATTAAAARCDGVDGIEYIQRVVSLDQSPLGRSSRSCIATLCDVWNDVRRLFAKTRDARARGFTSQHFSFNSGEGRCSDCRGTGTRYVRMNFLPDAVVPCPTCHGSRFSATVRSIRFRDRSVADLLKMRVDEAADFFKEFQKLHGVIDTFRSVGLGYLTLGQPATTFSGGEAQRAKLAAELAAPSSQHTLYILDEPTSGLHPADVGCLMSHLRQLVVSGHSVIVIEHNPDVIRCSDWILDIGPESADQGGEIVYAGLP